jgi:hypothetical protein
VGRGEGGFASVAGDTCTGLEAAGELVLEPWGFRATSHRARKATATTSTMSNGRETWSITALIDGAAAQSEGLGPF